MTLPSSGDESYVGMSRRQIRLLTDKDHHRPEALHAGRTHSSDKPVTKNVAHEVNSVRYAGYTTRSKSAPPALERAGKNNRRVVGLSIRSV